MINIDEKLLNRDLICPDAFFLLCIMATYANKGGESVFPSNATLMAKTEFSEKKVIQLKKKLIAAGLIAENIEKRKENLAKKLAKTEKEFTNVSKVYAVNSAFIGKFVSKNTETARFERNCQFGKLPYKVVTSQGSYLKWQSKYWVMIETSIEEFERRSIEKENIHTEGVCDSFSSSNFGKDLETENLAIKEMDLDISTEKPQCNNVALKYSETVLNSNTTPANATLLQKAKEIGMVTRSEKFEIELLQKKEITIETALLALTNYATELQEKNAIGTRFVSSFKNFFGEGKYSSYLAVILPTIETEVKTVTYNGKDFEVVRTTKNGQKYAAYNGGNVRVKKAMKNKADFAVTDKEGKLYDFGKDYGFEENQNRDFLKYIVEKG